MRSFILDLHNLRIRVSKYHKDIVWERKVNSIIYQQVIWMRVFSIVVRQSISYFSCVYNLILSILSNKLRISVTA